MKKGTISLDAVFALILLFFIVTWLENFASFNAGQVNSFGIGSQTKCMATGIGTQMNAFYALNPGSGDYLDLSGVIGKATNFTSGEKINPVVSKSNNALSVKVSDFSSTYPVSRRVNYNPNSKKVTQG